MTPRAIQRTTVSVPWAFDAGCWQCRSKAATHDGGRSVLPLSVRRTLRAMRAAPERALDLAALAAIGSVSTRTLQRHFKAFLGKTPQAVLHDIRFERAREDLLRASSTSKVTDIALRYAFVHLGRFSVEYRERYGEKPSETLLRRRKFLAQPRTNPTLAPTFARELPTISVLPIAGQGGDEPLARSVAAGNRTHARWHRGIKQTRAGTLSPERHAPSSRTRHRTYISSNRRSHWSSSLGSPSRWNERRIVLVRGCCRRIGGCCHRIGSTRSRERPSVAKAQPRPDSQ